MAKQVIKATAAPTSAPAELPPLAIGDYAPTDYEIRKFLLYGQSGSGKTYMAGTFPKPLFIDLESGMASLLPLIRDGRKILRVPSDGPIVDYDDFLDIVALVEQTIDAGGAEFQTVVVDSINQLQYLIMAYIVDTFDKTREYEDQLTRSDYGKLARMMEQAITRLFSLRNVNVVIICGTQQQSPEDQIWPSLVGSKTVPNLMRLADAVGYCYSVHNDAGVEHRVSFENCPEWTAKIRGASLPFELPNKYPF